MAVSNRPLEITVIAVLTLAVAAVRLLLLIMVALLPEAQEAVRTLSVSQAPTAIVHAPMSAHYLMSGLGVLVFFVSGVGLLRARVWSRPVLLVWATWALVFSYLTTGSISYVTPGVVVLGVLVVVLLSPRAQRYFRPG